MEASTHVIRIRGRDHTVSRDDVIAVAQRESPRRVNAYFVEVEGRRFPPKQLVRGAVPSAGDFDTPAAVRILRSLGFAVVRLPEQE